MATQGWGTVSYPGSSPGWASKLFQGLSRYNSGPRLVDRAAPMNSAETTYFCLSAMDGSSSRPWCLVDCSPGGARLLVDDPAQVPDTFTLVQKGPVAALWKCRVVWRSDSHIGVAFEGHRAD